MKTTSGFLAFALIILASGDLTSVAADDGTLSGSRLEQVQNKGATELADPLISPGEAQGFRIVQGEVLKMEGNTYLVRDETGKEVRLTVTKDSHVESAFEVGDRIVAQVSEQGVITLIKRSGSLPGTGNQPSDRKPESDRPR
jgi:hypothetical protein